MEGRREPTVETRLERRATVMGLLDHLVGTQHQLGRNFQPKGSSSLSIDRHLDAHRLFNRQVARR